MKNAFIIFHCLSIDKFQLKDCEYAAAVISAFSFLKMLPNFVPANQVLATFESIKTHFPPLLRDVLNYFEQLFGTTNAKSNTSTTTFSDYF